MQANQRSFAKSIIDSFRQAAFLLDTDGTILELNEVALTIAGLPGDKVVGKTIGNISDGAVETKRLWKEACSCAVQGETTEVDARVSLGSTSAAHTPLKFSVSPLRDAAGEVVFLLAVSQEHRTHALADQQLAPLQEYSAVIDSEISFRLMVESIEDYAMFMVNTDGKIISWNRGAERLTGYTESEAIGRQFSMLYPREQFDESHALHELSMARQNGRYEEEGVRVRKDGSRYHAQVIVWRINDDQGKTIGFAKITRDVTALKVAQEHEARLFESENRFRLMVESIEDYAMFMVNTRGLITSWNRGAERLTGYSEEEAINQPFSILYPKDQLTDDHAALELTMALENGHYEEEGPRVRKDGSLYHAQIIVWPMEDTSGQVVGFAKITRDVTERRKAEQALRDSEMKFRTITDAMPQMVWSTLPNGQWDYANQQWAHFTGIDLSVTAGDKWLELIYPDDQARAQQSWLRSVKTGSVFDEQFRLLHVSGSYRWTLARALPVRSDTGMIIRWMGTLTDIHDQKRSEADLQKAAQRKDEFLAMLAHELRNPLAPIRNSMVLLRRPDQLNNKLSTVVDIIERQVHHMTRIIDDLLDVARISRGKIELRKEPVELGELIRHSAEDFGPDFQNKNVHLSVETPVQPSMLTADRTRITQAIGNLLHNALKFTEASGQVSISLTHEDQNAEPFAVVKVKDTGVGMERELLDQVFVPFTQASQDLARSQGGLGLGLALIKGLIELHGGKVEAHSEGLGRGSEFTIYLPLKTDSVEDQGEPNAHQATFERLNIVLIDDNQDMVKTMAALLTLYGHDVKCAYDGDSGIRLIKAERPDLVLCDIGLPGGKDGYAVARSIRADPSLASTTLVALSGYGQEQDKKQSQANGFDGHLLKPVNFQDLAEVIRMAGAKVEA